MTNHTLTVALNRETHFHTFMLSFWCLIQNLTYEKKTRKSWFCLLAWVSYTLLVDVSWYVLH